MNQKNLKPFSCGENARENGRAGGLASGAARRERKRIKDIISELMELPAPAMDCAFLDDYQIGVLTNGAIAAISLVSKAKAGDITALKLILELTGELDKEQKIVALNTTPIIIAGEDELE